MWKIFTHLCYVFFINPTVTRIIVAFPFNIQFIAFSLYYFLNSKFFLIFFIFLILLLKRFNNFFAYKITNNLCLMHNAFSFFNHRTFFKAISNIAFCKNVFIFWYSNNITNFKFTILGNNFFTLIISIYVLYLTSTCLILIVIWYVSMHLYSTFF